MSAPIDGIEVRATEEEVVTMRIAGVDAEVPVAPVPIERTIEVEGIEVGAILPVEQNVAQIEVALPPVGPVEVVVSVYSHKVVEIDLVGCLVLLVGQIKFIRHLVGEEQCLLTCLLIAHCVCRDCHC